MMRRIVGVLIGLVIVATGCSGSTEVEVATLSPVVLAERVADDLANFTSYRTTTESVASYTDADGVEYPLELAGPDVFEFENGLVFQRLNSVGPSFVFSIERGTAIPSDDPILLAIKDRPEDLWLETITTPEGIYQRQNYLRVIFEEAGVEPTSDDQRAISDDRWLFTEAGALGIDVDDFAAQLDGSGQLINAVGTLLDDPDIELTDLGIVEAADGSTARRLGVEISIAELNDALGVDSAAMLDGLNDEFGFGELLRDALDEPADMVFEVDEDLRLLAIESRQILPVPIGDETMTLETIGRSVVSDIGADFDIEVPTDAFDMSGTVADVFGN